MSTLITATLPGGTTKTLLVDAIISESVNNEATITDHPVEVGSDISDNIRKEPITAKYEIVVSNTPMTSDIRHVSAEEAVTTLEIWQNTGAILSFPTTTITVSNMAIKSISYTRDAKTGGPPNKTGGIKISLGLKQIRFVQNQLITVAITKRSPGAASKTKTGKAASSAVAPNQTQLSKQLFGSDEARGVSSVGDGNGTLQSVMAPFSPVTPPP